MKRTRVNLSQMIEFLIQPVPLWLMALWIALMHFTRWKPNDRARLRIVERLEALEAKTGARRR